MTEKEFKRLRRSELLELLLLQTRETERLTQRLAEAEAALADRNLRMEKAGDLAHAVLDLNGVMDAAQAAARQYLDNIIRMEQETRLRCEQLLDEARQTAEQILQQARESLPPDENTMEQVENDGSNETSQLLGCGTGAETGTI